MRGVALSPDNLEFLDFLQLDQCEQIFIENKLKINVESGNITIIQIQVKEFWILFLISKIRLLVIYLTISLMATVIKVILIG